MKTECACDRCVGACKHQPGWFMPGEAEKAAAFLEMPWDDFKKKIIIDHCDNKYVDDAVYVYAPRKIGVDGPEEIRLQSNQRPGGVCVFLENDRCSIHEVKPFECRKVFACDDNWYGVRCHVEESWREAGEPLGRRPEYFENGYDE